MQGYPVVSTIDSCLACGESGLQSIYSFGSTPVADHLLSREQLNNEDHPVPLDIQFCPRCSLLQLRQSIDPAWMFDEAYPYFSSVTTSLLEHSKRHAEEMIDALKLDANSLVVEVASNDGYLLQYFAQATVPVLGIDPLPRQGEEARSKGIETLTGFFSRNLAKQLKAEGRQADLVIANNVLAHVPGLNDFVAGIAYLLKDDGTACIEIPYVVDLVDRIEFDTIYHQHLCYFSVTSLAGLFRRHGLYLNRIKRLPTLGGSLRLYLEKAEQTGVSVTELLAMEKKLGVEKPNYYLAFARQLELWKTQMRSMLTELHASGARIAAYGASAKGTMLLSYAGLDCSAIKYVVDINPYKQGYFLPGSHLPVMPVEQLLKDQPDFVLMLVWNIADEVLDQQSEYRSRGGKFIIPIPEPVIV